ncbi:MAG: ribose-phosphate pyrophosphokinase [Deltaproteobacteria bacterium]|nr:ribose-phosphate pyrophosphokinase [Deltaproteobacteria bacterium]MBW1928655.1 ribose-phosphate pyrophosphokinase [Deltaproteobacteria bacterium]MBW2025810.1 ribose-phosphate pyrophosphokinase [Deltaproteobacteria bacterium]MBW2125947.1 ribose-phosphate pyrophosphokinase [Deltaproteobacteria bacterium]RLB15743.1 MAG: phosphoribosylpyrophosphate synthetase [Deltaproteobacteria bacterium]
MGLQPEMKLFGGTSNPVLTQEVCEYLGIEPGKITSKTFSDGEIQVEIGENIRGRDVFILQSTCPPVNDNLMQLLIIMDALRRASAKRITAVIPYYGYARQDRKVKPRVPISAKLVADLITVSGANRVVSMDLHAGQIQGYFNIPVDNIFAAPILLKYINSHFQDDLVIVSPDAGGVERARAFAKRLNASLAIIDKRREAPNISEAMNIIGEVKGKTAIILDDMVDTAGTLTQAATALKVRDTKKIYACCTHPVLSGPAIERIEASPIDRLVVTNTIPLNEKAKGCKKIEVLSIAELLGETIKRIYNSHSVSTLFV